MKPSFFDPSLFLAAVGWCLIFFAPLIWALVGLGIVTVEGALALIWFYRNRPLKETP